jgi:hypothetical protein
MMIEVYHAREVEALGKKAPGFDLYGSNYPAANGGEIDSEAFAILDRRFPICTQRKIEMLMRFVRRDRDGVREAEEIGFSCRRVSISPVAALS